MSSTRLRITGRGLVGTALSFLAIAATGLAEAPETIVHALQRLHIEISKPALVVALRNPDKEVRGLAAAELAELKAVDTLPDILRAAEFETDPRTQVNIAAASVWMGSYDGMRMLQTICNDASASPYLRTQAARYVFDQKDHGCFRSMMNLAQPTRETDERIGALYLVTQMQPKSKDESAEVVASCQAALGAPDLRMRLEAAVVLGFLNDSDAIPSLRQAIIQEREEIVRAQMESTLKRLDNSKADR